MTYTTNQYSMLDAIARSEFNAFNGGAPDCFQDTITWANCIIQTKADQGTFTSLQNAGLAEHNGYKGSDGEVGLTEQGFAVWECWYEEVIRNRREVSA